MFRDRQDAGKQLAEALAQLDLPDPVVLALPRGGVPVALPIARRLNAPLDLLLVRKIGVPGNAELAAGAVVEGAEPVFNADVLRSFGLTEARLADAVESKRAEIAARRRLWLGARAPVPRAGKTLIVVDDGIATGATMRAALSGLVGAEPAAIVLAVPVAPPETLAALEALCTSAVCLETPAFFGAVGAHYARFDQVADAAVAEMIGAA
ncbi:phosphoribosyltransferase [Sinisalibacter aestuarii]|uniref:Phosphoribosyltransferase n=1 Tax=Sinisalibacter aestuarii TaxID=2949426 RepID=A0ABQ5LUV7_9RHOB|nr:phosphoribosyltransferase family protein [Sinisalibacter aestuarii]GKY88769.1 phosphoribosyltransferase [Sinisalibacter aestuarii]